LIVKPAYNFNLTTFLSGGLLGQFGLQITIDATNYLSYDVVNPEMVVVVVNSGLMVTQQGSSSLYSGLITKNMVLETKQQSPAIDSSSYHTGLRKVLKKNILEKVIVVVDFPTGSPKLVNKLDLFKYK
jgi:hypothetical protein